MAPRHILFNPVIEAGVVKLVASRSIAIVQRGERGVLNLLPQDLVHRLEVAVSVLLQVILAEEEIGILRAVGLSLNQVDELQAKTLRQVLDGFVTGIDELAAPLAGLSIGPRRRVRVHAASQA